MMSISGGMRRITDEEKSKVYSDGMAKVHELTEQLRNTKLGSEQHREIYEQREALMHEVFAPFRYGVV